jgi:hypothetical protein
MVRRSILVALSTVGSILVACSSDDGGSASATPDSACQDAAAALCEKLGSCFSIGLKVLWGDSATCITRTKIGCQSSLSATGTGATPAQFAQCATDVRAQSCEDLFAKPPATCETQAGTLADGQACAVNDQCSGRSCNKASGNACGACAKRAGAGSACETGSDCEADLACSGGKCVVRGTAGAACSATAPCVQPYRCSGKVCTKPLAGGAACTPTEDACDILNGFFCNPQSNVCAEAQIAEPGGACGFVGGNLVLCAKGVTCKTGAGGTGTCSAVAADGAPCNDANGPTCTAPARCTNGVCTLPDPAACK